MAEKFKTLWRYKWTIALYFGAAIVSQLSPWYYRSQALQADVKAFSLPLATFLAGHELSVLISNTALTAAITLFGIPTIKAALGKYIPLNENGLLTFLKMLEVPVEYKLDRFCQKMPHLVEKARQRRRVLLMRDLFS